MHWARWRIARSTGWIIGDSIELLRSHPRFKIARRPMPIRFRVKLVQVWEIQSKLTNCGWQKKGNDCVMWIWIWIWNVHKYSIRNKSWWWFACHINWVRWMASMAVVNALDAAILPNQHRPNFRVPGLQEICQLLRILRLLRRTISAISQNHFRQSSCKRGREIRKNF